MRQVEGLLDALDAELEREHAVPEDRDALVKCGMVEGWTQSLEKLEELLA